MHIRNSEIADQFDRLADLLEIEGANPFRVRAYRNAALTIREHPVPMAELLAQGADLSRLPGIGRDLANRIRTIVETGELPLLKELEHRVPPTLADLLLVKGLGPKRVKALYQQLEIRSAEDLKRAIRNGRIRELRGFGARTEQLISEQLERLARRAQRLKLAEAEEIATPLVAYLERVRGVKQVTVAGSFRRRRETVGDLDILVTAGHGSPVMARFVRYPEVAEVVSRGSTRSTVRLRRGLQVDLRVVRQVSYGAALVYFTGSKAHNIAIRTLAARQGLKINEYGVYRGERRKAGKTEASVYRAVGLPWIPPELRENRGEIEAAAKERLPELIRLEDIRGDLHCHTEATDGRDSLAAMAAAAAERGYEYLAISDHSQRVSIAHGLDRRRLREQIRAIDRLNERLDGIVLLKSIEVDILEDGRLDLPDSILKELDLRVCAIHSHFGLGRDQQTERILRAMDNRYCNVLAHPTGRLINEREPCALDLETVIEAAAERGCWLELNAHPDRLDLDDHACRLAKARGARLVISTDAHSRYGLANMRYGVDQARRGWLEKQDVVNTLPLQKLREQLRRA